MSKAQKRKLNAEIAKYFGFKVSEGKEYLINGYPQWTYPEGWYLKQGCIPNTSIPDFLRIIEIHLKLMQEHEFGGPREYFGRLDYD